MAYTSLAQLTDRYSRGALVKLTDRADVATGLVDADVIDRALADADAQIDGYLAVRYEMPLATTPPLIADLAQVITFWKLHTYDPDAKVKTDYENALRMLRDISAGTLRIQAAGVELTGTGGSGVQITDRERPLSAAQMKGFI